MKYDFKYFFAIVTGMPSKYTYQLMLKTTDEISRIIRVMSLLSIQAFPSVNLLPYIPTERERNSECIAHHALVGRYSKMKFYILIQSSYS